MLPAAEHACMHARAIFEHQGGMLQYASSNCDSLATHWRLAGTVAVNRLQAKQPKSRAESM